MGASPIGHPKRLVVKRDIAPGYEPGIARSSRAEVIMRMEFEGRTPGCLPGMCGFDSRHPRHREEWLSG